MNRGSKDSHEVVEFMALYARLKLFCDDTPEELANLAANDPSVRDLCTQLSFAAYAIQMNERRARVLFAAPVDPAFLTAWRDYEARYGFIVSGVWLSDLLPDLPSAEPSNVPTVDLQWESADDDAHEQAGGIEEAVDLARFKVENDGEFLDPSFARRVEEGVAAWDRLSSDTGFDLRGIFRRRALVPFVLVPRKVAAKHGSAETHSMLRNLQQAHDAFVFGAAYAALALMRSIMEAVLRDHYSAEGKDLNERIRNARGRLPPGANEAALHRLRKLANAVLHLDREMDEGLPTMDKVRLEKEIVSLLFASGVDRGCEVNCLRHRPNRRMAMFDTLPLLCDRLGSTIRAAETTRARVLEALLHGALTPNVRRPIRASPR